MRLPGRLSECGAATQEGKRQAQEELSRPLSYTGKAPGQDQLPWGSSAGRGARGACSTSRRQRGPEGRRRSVRRERACGSRREPDCSGEGRAELRFPPRLPWRFRPAARGGAARGRTRERRPRRPAPPGLQRSLLPGEKSLPDPVLQEDHQVGVRGGEGVALGSQHLQGRLSPHLDRPAQPASPAVGREVLQPHSTQTGVAAEADEPIVVISSSEDSDAENLLAKVYVPGRSAIALHRTLSLRPRLVQHSRRQKPCGCRKEGAPGLATDLLCLNTQQAGLTRRGTAPQKSVLSPARS
ncbi:PREDICTED: adenosine deaminase CECR1 isoform X2 [Chinchilla lanigera]|uniref:adenosine deaminase CECR1 isoform X2 n=1 Tax=Chinchilla lanigera TaxID=34839 RepID=UPI00038F065E|nr:PREDICTED: adenosine deaminase CECR1 isoform X2 [Chinchilla lanigera]